MLMKRLFHTALFLSLPFFLGGVALAYFDFLTPSAACLVWLAGFVGLLLLLYRPIKGLGEVASYLSQLEEVPGTPPPEIKGLVGSEGLSQVLTGMSRLVQRHSETGQRAQAELNILIDKLPMPLLQVDTHRRVIRQNRAAAKLTGEGALGRDLVFSLRHPELIAAVDQTIATHESAHIELTLGAPVEQTFIGHVVAPDPTVDQDAVLIVFGDITEVVQGERMRVDFVTNASHEIRSPLATLAGCIETLQGPAKNDPDGQEKFLNLASIEAKRMTTLVSDLLSLSQIEVSQHIAPSDSVDMASVLNRVIGAMAASPDGKATDIETSIPNDLPKVIGDDSEIQQVFQNLLANAARYGGERVKVSAAVVEKTPMAGVSGRVVKVEVRDWGQGIDPVHIPRLTERFYRVDTVRSRELGGTGLGLAIVKHVVNRHRGVMEIESVVNEGTVFSIYLPTVTQS